jgi:hypothetical protein
MESIRDILNLARSYEETFEALASMEGEDASKLNFGLGLPPEYNDILVLVARRFQGMLPIDDMKQAIELGIQIRSSEIAES